MADCFEFGYNKYKILSLKIQHTQKTKTKSKNKFNKLKQIKTIKCETNEDISNIAVL